MKKNHFFFGYNGNKREEAEKLYNLFKLDNVKTIIEPYCGSCAISYYISKLNPKKFKYILNDYNKSLIEILKIIKDDKKTEELENIINNHVIEMNKLKDFDERKIYYNKLVKSNTITGYLFGNKYYQIRPNLCPKRLDKHNNLYDLSPFYFKQYPIYEFFKTEDIEIYNIDGKDIYTKYKNDKSVLIFLDPPYMATNNEFYNNGGGIGNMNIYEYLNENSINKEKAKIYMILENMWIMLLLFKKYIIETNDKLYQTSKKQTSHITISNIK